MPASVNPWRLWNRMLTGFFDDMFATSMHIPFFFASSVIGIGYWVPFPRPFGPRRG